MRNLLPGYNGASTQTGPFVQVSRALLTDAGARDQIVQYKDVGTKLTVRPTISFDGCASSVAIWCRAT